ncbi:MAG: XdhC family protein [Candidatus Dormibacteria bacterium]
MLGPILAWQEQGQRVALARLVGAEGSSPREAGAAMAVSEGGEVVGSVSGGCVEGAVVEAALRALADRRPPEVLSFGYSDAQAFAVGLTCGGTVRLLLSAEPEPWLARLRGEVAAERPAALATVIEVSHEPSPGAPPPPAVGAALLVADAGGAAGGFGDPELDRIVIRDSLGALASGRSAARHYGLRGEARRNQVEVFIEVFAPPPQMVIFGAVDFTAALARAAKLLGYRVTVCDPRSAFATEARLPMADRVLVEWPHRYLEREGGLLGARDAICVLTHDPKFDVPALRAALATQAGYIGAMGSRRTERERTAALLAVGVERSALARVMGPIGVDIGARTPEETAVSILAEIIALRSGRRGGSLRDREGAIHAGAPGPSG